MFEPYRRDAVSKSFFRIAEILVGASFVSNWYLNLPLLNKIAFNLSGVIVFIVAWISCPPKPFKGERL
jgi:hypothetical protein